MSSLGSKIFFSMAAVLPNGSPNIVSNVLLNSSVFRRSLNNGQLLYFRLAHEAIFEIGVKLGQVLWRKILPGEVVAADANLASLSYELLKERKFRLAQKVLDFASSKAMKHADEKYRLIFLVNRAQSYKWDGIPALETFLKSLSRKLIVLRPISSPYRHRQRTNSEQASEASRKDRS